MKTATEYVSNWPIFKALESVIGDVGPQLRNAEPTFRAEDAMLVGVDEAYEAMRDAFVADEPDFEALVRAGAVSPRLGMMLDSAVSKIKTAHRRPVVTTESVSPEVLCVVPAFVADGGAGSDDDDELHWTAVVAFRTREARGFVRTVDEVGAKPASPAEGSTDVRDGVDAHGNPFEDQLQLWTFQGVEPMSRWEFFNFMRAGGFFPGSEPDPDEAEEARKNPPVNWRLVDINFTLEEPDAYLKNPFLRALEEGASPTEAIDGFSRWQIARTVGLWLAMLSISFGVSILVGLRPRPAPSLEGDGGSGAAPLGGAPSRRADLEEHAYGAARSATHQLRFNVRHLALRTPEADDDVAKAREAPAHLAVLYYTASWCGPCRAIAPTIESLADEYPAVDFLKIDVDEYADAAADDEISAMPTFKLYKGGKVLQTIVGADAATLENAVYLHNGGD